MSDQVASGEGLRQRKKRRTRRALVEAAMRLFAERGYDLTTIADITAAAEVSTSTFFSYFRSKDDLLFADTDERLEMLSEAFADREPGERPIDALRRVALRVLPSTADDLMGAHRDERLQAILSRPALQARALQRVVEAERHMAARLQAAFPSELSKPQAVAVTGALVAVAMHTMENGGSFDRIRANLDWTLDLLSSTLDSYREPPGKP